MTERLKIGQDNTAILIMDYQNKQLFALSEVLRDKLLKNASKVLAYARSHNIPVIYVEVRDRQGPPEFRPWDTTRRQNSGRDREMGTSIKL